MSIQKIIQESINENPLEMKGALAEELRNRVAEAIAAKMEEVEQIDELKRSTLASYVKKAAGAGQHNTLPNAMRDRATAAAIGDKEWYKQSGRTADKRSKGIQKAADRLAKD